MRTFTRRITCIIILFTIVFPYHLKAQQLLKMTEITTGGNVYEMNPDTAKRNKSLTRYPSVDINSLIKITVDTSLIKQEALKFTAIQTNLPVAQMKGVSDFLSKRLDRIKEINVKGNDMAEKRKALESFSNEIIPIFEILDQLDSSNSLKIKVNKILIEPGLSTTDIYNGIFDLLQDEISSIGAAYKSSIEQNKVFFRLGTSINNTPVHLDGFDNYKEGDYYFVPPFITTIPEDQKNDFQKYKELATQANAKGLQAFSGQLQEVLNPLLATIKKELQDSISGPLTSFENAVSKLNNLSTEVKTQLAKNEGKIVNLVASIDLLKAYITDVNQDNYLENLAKAIAKVFSEYTSLKQSLNDLGSYKNEELQPAFNSALADFKKGYEEGKQLVDRQIDALHQFVASNFLQQIGFTKKMDESLLKLADEVSKLPLDNIPNQTMLDLKKTVVRKNGDRLFFKAVLTKASSETEKQEEKTIDYTSIGLYQIGLHNSIQATMILVHNLSGKFKSEKQFQFAPSYSVLFKNGSRKSSFYNDFLDFGLGVNVATLDFNKDDNPEVGLGLVVSSFKDYLQLGCGRNFGVDQNYWFFGIRLPLLGFNIDRKLDISTDNP